MNAKICALLGFSLATTAFANANPPQPEQENVEVVKVDTKEIKHFREGMASTKAFLEKLAKENGKKLIWKATGDTPYTPVPELEGNWKAIVLSAVENFNTKLGKTYGYDEVQPFVCQTSLVISTPTDLKSVTKELCSVLYYEKEMKYYVGGKELNVETLRLVEDEEREAKLLEEQQLETQQSNH